MLQRALLALAVIVAGVSAHHFVAITNGQDKGCEDQCREAYNDSESALSSCHRGCRLAVITDAVNVGFNGADFNETVERCNISCESSYDVNEAASCMKGCKLMVPFLQQRRSVLRSPLDLFFGNAGPFSHIHLPQLSGIGDDEEDGVESVKSQTSRFGNVFKHMQDMMKLAMQKVSINLPMLPTSSGKMVVIKSGPGFQETKTYNIGPDFHFDDIINQKNPLDYDQNLDNVEVSSSNFDDNFLKSFNNGNEMFKVFHHNEEEPRLPESGLKTRFILHDSVCAQDPSEMSWSDWASCLHRRIGMPRWITAAAISLGIVFILWICLTIPQTAPRQRIWLRAPTKEAMAKAKEAEANASAISVLDIKTLDAPPAYDDLTSLRVALVPIHEKTENATTGEKSSKA